MQRLNSVITSDPKQAFSTTSSTQRVYVSILLHYYYVINGPLHNETFQAACKQGGDSLTLRSDVCKGNRIQHCDIPCPSTSLRESSTTTKTAAMTLQCNLATSIQCSLSTDYNFLFPPHRPVSEGVISSRHCLYLLD